MTDVHLNRLKLLKICMNNYTLGLRKLNIKLISRFKLTTFECMAQRSKLRTHVSFQMLRFERFYSFGRVYFQNFLVISEESNKGDRSIQHGILCLKNYSFIKQQTMSCTPISPTKEV